MRLKKKKPLILSGIAFILFCLSALYITFPLIFHIETLATGLGDELIIAWIQSWVIHSLLSGNIFSVFEANIYFPYHNTLAFSETFISSSIFLLPVKLFFKEPIALVNLNFICSLILLGFSVYLLSYYLTKSFFASLLSGILVIFSPAVVG